MEPFDHASWVKGLTLDFTPWSGVAIKIKKVKPAKRAREIKPAIHVLTSEHDNVGRTVADHRGMVDYYASMYDSGKGMFDSQPITDADEQRGIEKPRSDEPWREERKSAYTDEDGLALLRNAFKEMHDAEED